MESDNKKAKPKVKIDITGQRFGNWIVLEELGGGKIKCQCQCENKTEKVLYKKAVREGKTKSCGCLRGNNCNITRDLTGSNKSKYDGQKFGEWTVIKRIPHSEKVLCRCSCNIEKEVYIQHLLNGKSKSCGHLTLNDLTGKQFGEWTVLKEIGNGKVLCQCSCKNKTQKEVYKATLIRGQSRSCGCKQQEHTKQTMMEKYGDICTLKVDSPREDWQINTLNSKEAMAEFLDTFDNKPNITELCELLQVNKSSILRKIREYSLESKVQFMYNDSYMEIELYEFIKTTTNCNACNMNVLQHVRDIIPPYELDIYIPEKKIAIEFNGTYWHSDLYKNKRYHQNKTIECIKNGIRLIHIFEYEWEGSKKDIIKAYLKNILQYDKEVIYARKCSIQEISSKETEIFEKQYHLQGYTTSSINIALIYKDKIVGLMTFGTPRFSNEYEYELIRLCYKSEVTIVGGAEKMFKYFTNTYKPSSIISYCNIAKFTGEVYRKLGFQFSSMTEPNYVWVNGKHDVMTRYQTQKHRLITKGLGTEDQTEDEIMRSIGYFKIYDCGNTKFIYKNN